MSVRSLPLALQGAGFPLTPIVLAAQGLVEGASTPAVGVNPLAVAVQGLGFMVAMIALQGLLAFVAEEVRKYEAGGGIKTRRRVVGISPTWVDPWEEDEALLLAGII